MWQLFADQLNRNRSAALSFAGILVALPLLAPLVQQTGAQGRGLLYFTFYFFLFWGGFVGVGNAMGERKGLRVVRVLPLRSRDLAWTLWLGAIAPGALLGAVACGGLLVSNAIPGFDTEFPVGIDRLVGLAVLTVVWACCLAGVAWTLLMMMGLRLDIRLAVGAALFLFVGISVLAPVWIGSVAPGWSFGDALGARRSGVLALVILLAGASFWLAPRVLTSPPESRSPVVPRWTAAGRAEGRPLRRRGASVLELLRVFALAMGATLAGSLVFSALPALGGGTFRVNLSFLLVWTFLVPGLWMTVWLPSPRVFRCLPLSAARLAALPVLYTLWLWLAAGVSALIVLVLAGEPPDRVGRMLAWLCLCPGLLTLLYAVPLRGAPSGRAGNWLRIWAMVVALGALSDLVSNFGWFRGVSELSLRFWPTAVGGLVLIVLGYVALRRSLVAHGATYRPAAPTRA